MIRPAPRMERTHVVPTVICRARTKWGSRDGMEWQSERFDVLVVFVRESNPVYSMAESHQDAHQASDRLGVTFV